MNDKDDKIYLAIMRDIYQNSTPKADFDTLPYTDQDSKFFMDYKIDKELCDIIIERHLKKFRVAKFEYQAWKVTIYLGCSPKFSKT